MYIFVVGIFSYNCVIHLSSFFLQKLIKDALFVCTGGTVLFAGISVYQGHEKFYRQYVMPFLQPFCVKFLHQTVGRMA
jgi:hypothetical protein